MYVAETAVKERVTGFEPVLTPWKGGVLPLHHTRSLGPAVGAPGFEPGTSRTQTVRATGLRHAPNELAF